ncbi:3'(2'),5'-bisphosphate nucleotidase CysQ [Lysobacter sp. SG-8]|uniref:3'(2'),5'-bisphosphate nucleotidase CysQ n=1 Tax=Marilutibacter penaei TaxID=2759900 RepID=A0A7W3U407_9GAMM|nr:3'(2'),5'-bisphosphate nucleotidase CysQ [Lysobacter penaei]MBB1088494.1 3'(2'),5'-bisphosphate nucleotidase CysQ [Lysobacter penaei]
MTETPITPELREGVAALAEQAGRAILGVYESDFAVEHKDDRSPLTAADLAAHRCIVEGLAALTPDIPVLSEESADEVPTATRRGWSRLWVVDPLDGTREFIKRNGEFTVNIALVEGGDVVFGVVHAPVTGVTWAGGRGLGATRSEGGEVRPMAVRAPAVAPLRVAASRSHRDERTQGFIDRMGEVEPIGLGSSLKFCRIAEGGMDVYPRFGPTSEWDTAAAQAVLEGAGGAVLDLQGRPFRYNQRDTILNGEFIALGDTELPWPRWAGSAA